MISIYHHDILLWNWQVGSFFSFLFYNFTVDAGAELLFLSIVFTSLLLVVSVIDAETMLIPDRFSIGGAFLGLILSFFSPFCMAIPIIR